jgi:hypothetical protein
MGLTITNDFKLPSAEATAGSREMDVAGSVISIGHLYHKSSVRNPGSKSRAKGKGISEIEVFIAYTDAKVLTPPPVSEFVSDGYVYRGVYVRIFNEEQVGLCAWYYARKVIRRKKIIYGPPSEAWSGVIA